MKPQKTAMTREQEVLHDTVVDYTENMFQDGNNRTAKVKAAKAYDEAVKVPDPDMVTAVEADADMPVDIARSRDGTEASGIYDEDGGPIGGTPDELDSLEAGGTPVDKNPHMKG